MERPAWLAGWKGPVIITAAALVLIYGLYAVLVSYSNGNDVHVTIHAGVDGSSGKMYYKCTAITGDGASCDDSQQTTVTVHKRDRVTFDVISDDGPGRTHDFKLQGGAYWLWPAGVEMEIQNGEQSGTFTAWSAGSYTFICELSGHEAAGMSGTLIVL